VAEVLPAESLDLGSLTARQVAELCPEATAEIEKNLREVGRFRNPEIQG
jgi:hypothetical protein